MNWIQSTRDWWRELGRESDQELDERFYEADGAARRMAINVVFIMLFGGLIAAALFLPDQITRGAALALFSGWATVLIFGYALMYRIKMWRIGVDVAASATPATTVRNLAMTALILPVTWIVTQLAIARSEDQPMSWASLGGALVGFVVVYGVMFIKTRSRRRVPDSPAADDRHQRSTEST